MESESDSVFDVANELGISVGRRRSESLPTCLTTHGKDASEAELDATTVAPRSNRVGELEGVGTAFHAQAHKGVGHESLAQAGVDRTKHQIGIGRPNPVRRILAGYCLLIPKGRNGEGSAASNPNEWRPDIEREAAEGSGYRLGVFKRSKKADTASNLGSQAGGYCQIR